MKGKVTLVGAGPGDPGLLTVKGRQALQRADVVVYDRLVGPAILAMMPEHAKKIDVGKVSSYHKVPQERINEILLEEALEGHHVVRLKGGDPFVFGRGGEELELLVEHGVEFEEVPGITSAIAAAAYAGIPVTHRDYCSSLHIITGHARKGKELEIDYEALVRLKGTLVFLMGVAAMPTIVKGLLEAGMDPHMPAAMVESGTTPEQRRCLATLETLPDKAVEMGIHSPAIILVGKVCDLSQQFCWFEKQPLHGKRFVVTRPKERMGTLSEKLRGLGADVWEFPCIGLEPIVPCPSMTEALKHLENYEWIVFTSPAGVQAMDEEMQRLELDGRALAGVRLGAIGPGTAKALRAMGLRADYVPEVYDAKHLGEGVPATGKVLILRAEIGTPDLTEALQARGVSYEDVAVYQTRYEHEQSAQLREEILGEKTTYVTFTSASTVKGFVSCVGEDCDFSRMVGLCIGEQTAAQAKAYGIPVHIAQQATIEAMVALAQQVWEG